MAAEILNIAGEWKEWSNYVINSLSRLETAINELDKTDQILRSEIVEGLNKIKEKIISEISKCQKEKCSKLKEVVNDIEEIIESLKSKIQLLESSPIKDEIEEKIESLRNEIIIPMDKRISKLSIKIGIICAISGAIGASCIPYFIGLVFSG